MNVRTTSSFRVEHATRVRFAATRREDRERGVVRNSPRIGTSVQMAPAPCCPRRVAGDGTRVACSTRILRPRAS